MERVPGHPRADALGLRLLLEEGLDGRRAARLLHARVPARRQPPGVGFNFHTAPGRPVGRAAGAELRHGLRVAGSAGHPGQRYEVRGPLRRRAQGRGDHGEEAHAGIAEPRRLCGAVHADCAAGVPGPLHRAEPQALPYTPSSVLRGVQGAARVAGRRPLGEWAALSPEWRGGPSVRGFMSGPVIAR